MTGHADFFIAPKHDLDPDRRHCSDSLLVMVSDQLFPHGIEQSENGDDFWRTESGRMDDWLV